MKIGYPTWLNSSGLKQFAIANSLNVYREDEGAAWYVFVINGEITHETRVFKDGGSEQTDFESSFPTLNKTIPASTQTQPFASKILPNGKKLYKREHGIQASVAVGANTILFTIPYPWVKIIGLEILFGEKLDTCDLMILDSTSGTYSGVPNYQLNQFGYNVNIAADLYEEESAYDADLYQGMQIKIVYNSQSAKTIGLNFNLSEVK